MGLLILAIAIGFAFFAIINGIAGIAYDLYCLIRYPSYFKSAIYAPWLGLFVCGFLTAALHSCSGH